MPTKEIQALIDFVKSGAQWKPLAQIDFQLVKDKKFITRTRRANGSYYITVRSREETETWVASKNTWLYDAEYLDPAESTKEQLLNLLLSLEVGESDATDDALWFRNHKRVFNGINAGEFIDEKDFLAHCNYLRYHARLQMQAEQSGGNDIDAGTIEKQSAEIKALEEKVAAQLKLMEDMAEAIKAGIHAANEIKFENTSQALRETLTRYNQLQQS